MAVAKYKDRASCEIKLKCDGRIVRFPGVRDRGTSKLIEARIVKLINAKVHHQPIAPEVLTWVRNLPTNMPRLFKRLAEEGLVDASLLGRRKLMDLLLGVIGKRSGFDDTVKSFHRNGNTEEQARRKVLVKRPDLYDCETPGFLQSLVAARRTPNHVLETVRDIDVILTGCGFVYWDDFNCERLKQWLHQQHESRDDFGLVSANHHITSIKAFAKWCQRQLKRYGEAPPFEQVQKFNEKEDRRRPRRAATTDEMARIINATQVVGTVKRITAEDRAVLYCVALTMALRAKECWSLFPESFVRDDDGLSVIIEVVEEKARRGAKLPIPAQLAGILEPWLAKKPKGKRLWSGTWYREAAEMLRKDLEVAGVEYKTSAGYLDFHATRHTAITRGSRVMIPVDLKAFARHAKLDTTLKYVHIDEQELREGVDRLPAIGGTNGAPAANFIGSDAPSEKSVHKRARAGVSETQVGSFAGSDGHSNGYSRNDATPRKIKGLAAFDIDCLQRARRDSNPQPPDRQSGTLTN